MDFLLTYYLLVKESFWDQLLEEFEEIGAAIKDFFVMIKDIIDGIFVDKVGSDIVNLFLIGIGVVAIMLVCLAIINR